MRSLYHHEAEGETRFSKHRGRSRASLNLLIVFSCRCGQFVPDFPRDEHPEQCEGHQEYWPPFPVMARDVPEAEGLQTAAQIGESVNDSGASGRRLSSAEIRRCRAGHQRGDPDGCHDDGNRRPANDLPWLPPRAES